MIVESPSSSVYMYIITFKTNLASFVCEDLNTAATLVIFYMDQ